MNQILHKHSLFYLALAYDKRMAPSKTFDVTTR